MTSYYALAAAAFALVAWFLTWAARGFPKLRPRERFWNVVHGTGRRWGRWRTKWRNRTRSARDYLFGPIEPTRAPRGPSRFALGLAHAFSLSLVAGMLLTVWRAVCIVSNTSLSIAERGFQAGAYLALSLYFAWVNDRMDPDNRRGRGRE